MMRGDDNKGGRWCKWLGTVYGHTRGSPSHTLHGAMSLPPLHFAWVLFFHSFSFLINIIIASLLHMLCGQGDFFVFN